MLASRALLSWLPGLIQTGVFSVKAAGAVVAKLQHAEDSWMREWSNALSKEQIEGLLESTLHALHHSQDEGQTIPSSVSSVAALGTVALHLLSIASLPRERVTQLRGVLVAGLARGCSTWRSVHRDRMLSSLLSCFESFRGDSSVNTTPVLKLLSQQPTLHNQQRLTIFAALHAVESGQRHAAVTAANWVTHALHHMNQGKPLAQFFDRFHPDHAPHLVVLPDTKLNDNGELMVGQVRGSVAVYPNRGGKYYYEMVLPPNYSDRQKTIVMGWGSKLHEVQGSSQHVGSDFHSWGFNGRNRIRLLTGEQEIAVPHNTVSGDVIGSLLDLERKQMCWSINGELLQWVDIPLQGDGEPIYPYVSASVDPHFVLVLLNETQYLPEGFTEFTSNLDDPNLREASTTAPPQSFTFYKELTSLVNELSNSGLRIEELVVVRDVEVDAATPLPVDPATDYVDRSIALLPQYPHICNYLLGALDSIRGTTTPSDCEEEEVQRIREVTLRSLSRCDLDATIIPYLRHLFCLNAMSTVVAKRTDLIRDSPFLWGLYHQARDLLFFSARWALIDVHLSRKLNRSGDRRPLVVTIDRRRAMSIAETKRSLPPTTIAPLPANVVDDVLRHSVVGQMFQGMTGKEVYTYLTMFTVQLQDNITEDAGGVTRSMLSLLCDELMWSYPQQQQQSTVVAPTTDDEEEEERMEPQQAAAIITMSGGKVEPVVPLFIPTDHSTYFNLVPNMKWLATLTTEQEALAMQLYEWLGKLFGNAVLAGTLVYALNFPRLIWKFLAREEATMEDFYADCSDSDRGAINDDDFLLSDEDFYRLPGVRQHHMAAHDQAAATASLMHDDEDDEHDGELVSSDADLVDTPTSPVPGGGEGSGMSEVVRQRIASARRLAASQGLLHQYDKVLEKIRSGFESVVPAAAVEQMRWDDVRQRVSGSDGVTAADILANMDMTSLSASMQAQLTQVVNALAPPARSALLLFATGQRRLPVPEKIRVTCGDDPNELPTAHTCSPISMMLQPYRSTTEFIEKLSLSLAHVYEFGFV
ncbi:Hypothetical protein, putative [Bodo saltans]|nr:Hypothetical protein, putative [Bodo saltans]|eukprot:CUG89776.1 Hypothetical protein, putative [Bodo saltans]